MATNLSATSQAQLQSAIDLLIKGSAYETPVSEDVVQRIAPVYEALGISTVGGAYELLRDRPVTALTALVFLCGLGVFSASDLVGFVGPATSPSAVVSGVLGFEIVEGAYERPFPEDIIERLAPLSASTGFLGTGNFYQAIRDNPVSTMLKWALQLGSTTY